MAELVVAHWPARGVGYQPVIRLTSVRSRQRRCKRPRVDKGVHLRVARAVGAVLDVQSPGFSVDNAGPARERVPPRTPEVGDAVASGGVQTPAPTPMPQLSSDVDNSAEDDIALKATPLLHRQIEARLQETAHQDLVDATLAANPVPPTPSAPLKTRFDCDHDAFECVVDYAAQCCQ